jgi:hypothetical protein
LQAIGKIGLYPSGEGAGFAGGIVSAAVDGLIVGAAVLTNLLGLSLDIQSKDRKEKTENSVGFSY